MKTLIHIIIIMFASVLTSSAQFEYNSQGNIIPFSLSAKYRDIIDTSKINTCMLPSYNNDSLYWEANFEAKYIKRNYKSIKAGFPIDTLIDLKKVATKYILTEGTLWIYKFESKTAEGLNILLREFEFPEGAILSVFSSNPNVDSYNLSAYDKKTWDNQHPHTKFWKRTNDKTLFIELYEPKDNLIETPILIYKVIYDYYSNKKKSGLETLPNHLKKDIPISTLKQVKSSGSDCQYDVVCPDVPDYKNESKSICYIEIQYMDGNSETQWALGTGFFINKSNNYSSSDKPFMISAGHNFNIVDYRGPIDFSNGYPFMKIYINKQNKYCNDPVEYAGGTLLPNSKDFKVIKLGNSYNKGGTFDYKENEDYALVQAPGTVQDYANYKILYNAWIAGIDYTMTDWVAIGHPDGDAQKIFVDAGKPYKPDPQDYFGLFFDKGLSLKGSSGSPIFNRNKQVVGLLCSGNKDNSCAYVGTDNLLNKTYCGDLSKIHYDIRQYIDPDFLYKVPAYTAPLPTLPGHCKNCVKDDDETDIDCGGSCLPCGIMEKKTISTLKDITSNVRAKYTLDVIPESIGLISLNGGTYIFEAGQEMNFKNGFEIKNGVDFTAQIKETLMSEPDQGCQKACIFPFNVFSPNGDGVNEFWGFNNAFIKKYDVWIYDRDGNQVASYTNRYLFENGFVPVWNGSGQATGTYYYTLNYTDCYGAVRQIKSYFSLFAGEKKSDVEGPIILNTEIINDNFNIIPSLNVFPNPTDNILNIEYSEKGTGYDYSLIDQTGKTILSDCANDKVELDLSGFSPGLYILRIKVGNDCQVRKIIKR